MVAGLLRNWAGHARAPAHSTQPCSIPPPALCPPSLTPTPAACLPPRRSTAQYTGPLSSPEYLNHLPRATEYRRIAPV